MAATGERIHGLQMANCETRTVTINGAISGCTPQTACHAALSVAAAEDGYWYIHFSEGTRTGCTSTRWWSR